MKRYNLMKYRIFPLFVLLLWGTKVEAQQENKNREQVWSLKRVLDSIDTQNAGLQQFSFKTKAADKQAEAAKAWPAPTVGVGLSEFPYNAKMQNGMVARKMPMIELQQMFPNFSRQRNQKAYYKSFARLNQNDRATLKNRLFSRAKMAYADAFIAEKKLGVLEQQEKQINLLLKIAEGRLQYSKAALPNIYKIRAKISDLKSRRIKIESTVDQSTAIMNSLMNRPAGQSLTIDTVMDWAAGHLNILMVDSGYIESHRSDVARITSEIKTQRLQQKAIRSQGKPTFGITWDNMRMDGGMYMYNIMATVSIPVIPWSSKGYKSEARAKDYEIQAMDKARENMIQKALGAIRKNELQLQAQRKDLKIFESEVIPAYRKTLQANLNAFSENAGNIYETLTAWEDLTEKEFEYYEKLSDLIASRIELETEIQKY